MKTCGRASLRRWRCLADQTDVAPTKQTHQQAGLPDPSEMKTGATSSFTQLLTDAAAVGLDTGPNARAKSFQVGSSFPHNIRPASCFLLFSLQHLSSAAFHSHNIAEGGAPAIAASPPLLQPLRALPSLCAALPIHTDVSPTSAATTALGIRRSWQHTTLQHFPEDQVQSNRISSPKCDTRSSSHTFDMRSTRPSMSCRPARSWHST